MEEIIAALREKYKDRKICIGVPSPNQFDVQFSVNLLNLVTQNASFLTMGITNAIGSRITKNRCAIVDSARKMGATDVLMLDADGKFPTNSLLRLLAHDKDIVGAAACRREGSDRSPICEPVDMTQIVPGQKLVQMLTIGMQMMLIKMSVFDKLRKPYFADVPHWAIGGPQDSDELIGEDAYFCAMARGKGLEIWGDMELTMEIGHIGSQTYYVEQNKLPNPVTPPQVDIDLSGQLELSDEAYHRARDGLGE